MKRNSPVFLKVKHTEPDVQNALQGIRSGMAIRKASGTYYVVYLSISEGSLGHRIQGTSTQHEGQANN
ncbi:hypothetical protein LX36DRAFT_650323 [Colletotrichum falcatum]|nr:hypothetical protein LX36DRAFT_650323 [Colletotrichum falcatum]